MVVSVVVKVASIKDVELLVMVVEKKSVVLKVDEMIVVIADFVTKDVAVLVFVLSFVSDELIDKSFV